MPIRVRVIRTRIGIGAGYAWRRGSFELATLGQVTVEPWVARIDGERARFGDGRRERALVGGALQLAPGLYLPTRDRISLSLSPWIELAASGNPRDRFRVPRLELPGEEAVRLRVGGLELSVGIRLTLWIGLPDPAPRRTAEG